MSELPNADRLLNDLLVIDGFIPDQICDSLVAAHRRFVEATEWCDNGLPVQELKYRDSASFRAVPSVDRSKAAICRHFKTGHFRLAAETSEFYFVPSSVRKSVCTFVRQLRGPHFST